MRKIAALLFLCFMPISLFAQTYKMYQTRNYHNQLRLNTATGEVLQVQDDGQSWKICDAMEDGGETDNRFCLYETQNMWTFIMLDTFTGKNWQVQFSTKGTDYMFAAPINYWSKAYPSSTDRWQGRFKMFATQNMWTFIMLDSFTGRLWQVQFNTKSLDDLLCVSINEEVLEAGNASIFTIQPMTSMYQYYLISNKSGAMWQFQWTTKGPDYRWIKRVN